MSCLKRIVYIHYTDDTGEEHLPSVVAFTVPECIDEITVKETAVHGLEHIRTQQPDLTGDDLLDAAADYTAAQLEGSWRYLPLSGTLHLSN